jgi:hypothetical protein
MATLKFKPDELLKKMRVNKYTADMLIKSNQQDVAANTGKMAADWYKNWKKENGIPSDSKALPPIDSVPTWARPHLFPRAEARDGMKIASLADGRPDPSMMNYVTEKGFFLDGRGNAYQQRGNKFGAPTEYNPDIHGLPVPIAKGRDGLKIAKKKKRNAQRAYEDFVRDSQNMPLDESFKDLRRGIDREGLDIMKDVLGLDEA